MVEKFKTILQQMTRDKGAITFFGILNFDNMFEKWSVTLAAPWATDANHSESFDYVLGLIKSNLDPIEASSIARISIFPKEEHLIQQLLQFKEGVILENQKVNGDIVYQGYVLASNREV